jgi:hypothetical protein
MRQPPIVFVSYSWDGPAHRSWVRDTFVNGLRGRGVDALMDVHRLRYGDKIDEFMETLLPSCDHIAVICTPNYEKRAKHDLGGVGYEKALIKRFMATYGAARRVVPVLRSGDETAVPAFLGSRLWVDIRDDCDVENLLDELAALFYGQQVHRAPPVANPPAWLQEYLHVNE